MRKSVNSSLAVNLEMSDAVYALRKQVMDFIYEANEVVKLPRITVRIAEPNESQVLGVGRLGECIIWITPRAIANYDLRAIVYHEIIHAVYSAEHNEKCPLMCSTTSTKTKLSKAVCQKILKSYGGK